MARSTTGEGWHKIAYDLMEDSEGCVDIFSISAESLEAYVEPCARNDNLRWQFFKCGVVASESLNTLCELAHVHRYQANLTYEEAMHLSDKTTFGALAANGCHPPVVFELFMIFIYLSVVCMMNVFLAVVLGAFGAQSKEKKGIVSSATFNAFVEQWRCIDDDMDLFVAIPELMVRLGETAATHLQLPWFGCTDKPNDSLSGRVTCEC